MLDGRAWGRRKRDTKPRLRRFFFCLFVCLPAYLHPPPKKKGRNVDEKEKK